MARGARRFETLERLSCDRTDALHGDEREVRVNLRDRGLPLDARDRGLEDSDPRQKRVEVSCVRRGVDGCFDGKTICVQSQSLHSAPKASLWGAAFRCRADRSRARDGPFRREGLLRSCLGRGTKAFAGRLGEMQTGLLDAGTAGSTRRAARAARPHRFSPREFTARQRHSGAFLLFALRSRAMHTALVKRSADLEAVGAKLVLVAVARRASWICRRRSCSRPAARSAGSRPPAQPPTTS
jgi:hypothetical protein